jgi:hypothetical protein
MRRSIVPLALVLATAAVWVLGIAGPATAAQRAPRILCPYTTAHLVSCCPVPPGASGSAPDVVQPLCCQTTPCCVGTPCCATGAIACCAPTTCCPPAGCCMPAPCTSASVTIASSPNPSTAARKVVISGNVLGGSAAGAQVVLWRELAGQSSFLRMGQTTADSGGGYTFTLIGRAVMTDQDWYVTSNGMRSATLRQHVHALVGLSSSARSTTVGRPILLHGRVSPSHAGEVVLIEQRHGGSWHVLARRRLGRHSAWASSRRFANAGTVELRAVLRGDARNVRSVSRTVTVTVTP